MLTNFNKSAPTFRLREPLKSLWSPMELSVRAVLSVSCFYDPVFVSLEHKVMEMCFFFISSVRQLKITLNMHSSKHPLKSNRWGYGCKIY